MGGRYGGDITRRHKPARTKDWNRALEGLLPDVLPLLRRKGKTTTTTSTTHGSKPTLPTPNH